MIDVRDYIKILLKKKNITKRELCNRINQLESKIGESRTSPQNITNYLNGYWEFRPKVLVKYEKALGLEFGTLISMVSSPVSRSAKKELKNWIDKLYEGDDKR